MRVWGIIMIMLGVCMALLLILAMIGLSLSDSDMATTNTGIAFIAILLGIPSILLIKYGSKLRRKQEHAIEESDGVQSNTVHSIKQPNPSIKLRRVLPKTTVAGNPKPQTIECKNCGASKTFFQGQETHCDYCGTIL